MNKRDIEIIEFAKAITEYCGNKETCRNCPFYDFYNQKCLLLLEDGYFPVDWKIPERR